MNTDASGSATTRPRIHRPPRRLDHRWGRIVCHARRRWRRARRKEHDGEFHARRINGELTITHIVGEVPAEKEGSF